MNTIMTHVGFGNCVSANRIIAIAGPKSAPIKRSVLDARAKDLVIDLTNGHRTKSVVFIDSQYIVLVALEPGTLSSRVADSV